MTTSAAINNVSGMTNTAPHAPRSLNIKEATMAHNITPLPGHTLEFGVIDAEFLIEGDQVVGPFGDIFPPLDRVITMSPLWVIAVAEGGSRVSFRTPVGSNGQPRVPVWRHVPLTD